MKWYKNAEKKVKIIYDGKKRYIFLKIYKKNKRKFDLSHGRLLQVALHAGSNLYDKLDYKEVP